MGYGPSKIDLRKDFFQAHERHLLLDGVDNRLKCLGIVHSKVCQHFPVETDVLRGDTAHELGIGHPVLTGGSVDTLDPEGAELSLLRFSVTVGIGETFFVGVLCNRPDVLPGKEIAAGFAENLLAACP